MDFELIEERIKKQRFPNGLYIVPTPIGNLGDITLRALHLMEKSDYILCEDTRTSGKMLEAYGIKGKKTLIYNEKHTGDSLEKIISLIKAKIVCLVSDAGTPLVCDPGAKIVNMAREEGAYITSLAGASAVNTALSLAGNFSSIYSFLGFFTKHTLKTIINICNDCDTFVFFENPKGLKKTLKTIQQNMPHYRCKFTIMRELTKLYEEVIEINDPNYDFTTLNIKGEVVIICQFTKITQKETTLEEKLTKILNTIPFASKLSIKDILFVLENYYQKDCSDYSGKQIYSALVDLREKGDYLL